MRSTWPVLAWLSDEERNRRQEERIAKEEFGEAFNALWQCGHRYPEQILPEEEVERYLCYAVCKQDLRTLVWLEERYTIVELMEFFALRRTDTYLNEEFATSD